MRSGIELDAGESARDGLTSYSPQTDYRYVTRNAVAAASVLRSVVLALHDGAQSARDADTALTYADGWAAAATLAQLVAFDAIRPE